jgi:predicted transcriptional regulator
MKFIKGKKGQFQKSTNSTKYKMVEYMGKRTSEHCRNLCVLLGIESIPKGFVVHHIDKNTHNNDIDNLSLMTITAHNRIHSHKPWNAGLTAESSEKLREMLGKAIASRKGHYVAIKGKEAFELKKQGITNVEIGKMLGISRESVANRIKAYLNYHKIMHPEQEKRVEKYLKIKDLRFAKNKSWKDVAKEIGGNDVALRRFYKNFSNK